MAATRYVPGMHPGATARNVAVGLVYLITAPLWLAMLWLTLPFAVWSNMDDIGTGLSFLPGVSEGGGAVSAAVVFVYLFVLYFVVLSMIPVQPPSSAPPGAGG